MASRDAWRLRGLDLLNFFTANVQTGFGPFIAAYLTINKWTQADIGLALSVGTITGMVSQVPAGALLDMTPFKRGAAAAGILSIAVCALMIGFLPVRLPVMVAEVLHGFASCVIVPSVAAISLALVGERAMGERLGRNSRWGAIGNGFAAGVMGLCGQYVSARSVFWLTALLALPAAGSLLMIGRVRDQNEDQPDAHNLPVTAWRAGWRLAKDRRVLAFAACVVLFHFSNAAMMPLAAGRATASAGQRAQLLIAGAIVLPQLVMASMSPWVGRAAQGWGRRPVLLIGFVALPLRALLLAALPAPFLLVPVQSLDGISAAVFGVMLPLIAADITRGRAGFNMCVGLLGLAAGIGATFSTTCAGLVADRMGLPVAFIGLGAVGALACLLIWLAMPETRVVGNGGVERRVED